MTISEKVLEKINHEQISSIPQWRFAAVRSAFWLLATASIFLGIISTSVILDILVNSDWDVYDKFALYYRAVPYLWVSIFAAFIISVIYNVRRSKRGYRYSLPIILGITLTASFIGGYIVFWVGISAKINDALLNKISRYEQIFDSRTLVWQTPNLGLLAGKIIELKAQEITLLDFNNEKWIIITSPITKIDPTASLEQGRMIKILGVDKNEKRFEAKEIRPWKKQKK